MNTALKSAAGTMTLGVLAFMSVAAGLLVAFDYVGWRVESRSAFSLPMEAFGNRCAHSIPDLAAAPAFFVGHVMFAPDEQGQCKEVLGRCQINGSADGGFLGSYEFKTFDIEASEFGCTYLGSYFADKTPLYEET